MILSHLAEIVNYSSDINSIDFLDVLLDLFGGSPIVNFSGCLTATKTIVPHLEVNLCFLEILS